MVRIPIRAMVNEPILKFHDVSKRFGVTEALQGVSFSVYPGEIHAVLGENGAGKTTLMKILMGIYHPDSGYVTYKGERTHFASPRDAIDAKIGMVFQHLSLIPSLTVGENFLLGDARTPFLLTSSSLYDGDHSNLLGNIRLSDPVFTLSRGERQKVEIFRLLIKGVDVLILDEPTAVLGPVESQAFFQELLKLKGKGKTILLVTHRLAEVESYADRISVLRDGRHIVTATRQNLDSKKLSVLMVGEELTIRSKRSGTVISGPVVLAAKAISISESGKGKRHALENLSFDLRAGECLGIAGVAGNGQKELVEILALKLPHYSGKILLMGEPLNRTNNGILAYIPDNARDIAVAPGLSVLENVMLKDFAHRPYSKRAFLNKTLLHTEAGRRLTLTNVKFSSIDAPVETLSGGNLQKLILARELSGNPKLIVAVNPTSGLDVKATAAIHTHLEQKKQEGCAVLLVSHDLDEILALSDSILVLYHGRSMGIWPADETSLETLGSLMAGYTPAYAPAGAESQEAPRARA